MTHLFIKHLELKEANDFVALHHRHHNPTTGHRFSIGCIDEHGVLHGCCIVGRPVARKLDYSDWLEVLRLCTDGTPNACSFLYSAAARAGKSLGYKKIQTYILESETGASVLASGWVFEQESKGGAWVHTDGKERSNTHPLGVKHRYGKML